MPAMSSGKSKRPTKVVKGGTESSRRHHFESFSQRIAKLNIDPIRRVRRHDLDEESLSTTASYFRQSLDEWNDLNLSEDYTTFAARVMPLCESLPQIIYYQEQIMDLLEEYIRHHEELSLESLLSLLAHFAHDLGARFEKYFARAVSAVSGVAAKHPKVEVIEWSFTCLAWLFKYLSRLLVPDLRPLYDLMAPLLGKEHQKPFVTRFAAEAMSFLVKRAGAGHHKDKQALPRLVKHAFADLETTSESKDVELYLEGLMNLFADAIKGIKRGLHSGVEPILQTLLDGLVENDSVQKDNSQKLVFGVLVNVIHHAEAATFEPVLRVVVTFATNLAETPSDYNLQLAARLITIIIGGRKGSRVENWGDVVLTMSKVLTAANTPGSSLTETTINRIFFALALTMQSAPVDVVLPHIRSTMAVSTNGHFKAHFLSFCNVFADLGSDRFQTIVLPYFQKFIVAEWKSFEQQICFLVPKLAEAGCLKRAGTNTDLLNCSGPWQKRIVGLFKGLVSANGTAIETDSVLLYAYLDAIPSLALDQSAKDQVTTYLHDLLRLAIQPTVSISERARLFAVSKGFSRYVSSCGKEHPLDISLWNGLCASASQYAPQPSFLQALYDYITPLYKKLDVSPEVIQPLVSAVTANLESDSHVLRSISLRILDTLYTLVHQEQCAALTTALIVEDTELSLQSARSISMHMRKLGSSYAQASSDPWVKEAIPSLCFGLLTVKFTPLWEDSSNALKEICESKDGEATVSALAFKWLERSPLPSEEVLSPGAAESRKYGLTAFEDSNLERLFTLEAEDEQELSQVEQRLEASLTEDTRQLALLTPIARRQAIRVLSKIPQVAERRSRELVPILLRWSLHHDEDNLQEAQEENGDQIDKESTSSASKWSRRDLKALLNLFTQFVNPKVFYKSADVYTGLLALLTNGDAEIQKSALKAIYTWKSPSLRPYEENLFNILDDARFREEISIFVRGTADAATMREEHKPELMPVLLRLLYGRLVVRKGSGSGSQEARRKAVLESLAQFSESDFEEFINIALGALGSVKIVENGKINPELLRKELLDTRKHLGLMNMIQTMLSVVGTQLEPLAGRFVDPVLYCLIRASRKLSADSEEQDEETGQSMQVSLQKSVRQVGYRCLNQLFSIAPGLAWDNYMPTIFEEIINPRLDQLPVQTAQSVSAPLQIFSTWSSSRKLVIFLTKYNSAVLPKVADCLKVVSAKENVKVFVLNNIVKRIIQLTEEQDVEPSEIGNEDIISQVIQPSVDHFLVPIGEILRKSPGRELLEAGVNTVSKIGPIVSGSSETRNLVDISTFLLDQPSNRVSPKTKSDLLRTLKHFLPLNDIQSDFQLRDKAFRTVSSLFGFFRDRVSRTLLSEVMSVFADKDSSLSQVASLCSDLNAFAMNRLDEPDFNRRLQAFNLINEEGYKNFTLTQWLPILYNMLFYVKDIEELAIRTNASLTIRRFVESTAIDTQAGGSSFTELLASVLLSALRSGVRDASESVRSEYLAITAHIVKNLPNLAEVKDMEILLVGDDEEASFFNNILHIQQHRRLRALRRLAAESQLGHLRSSNISHFFIPLIEHYIFNQADDSNAHSLAAETVTTIGILAEGLDWNQFRAVFRRYTSYIHSKANMEKTVIRLLGVVIDALGRAAKIEEPDQGKEQASEPLEDGSADTMAIDSAPQTSALAVSLPSREKLAADLNNNLLPPLTGYLHNKDESTVSLRVPVAVSIVKLIKILPKEQLSEKLPPVLTDVCNILRSKAQESRDMTRKTLAEISTLIGPSCFGFILQELRGALKFGYQLHVMSFTVHSILVATAPIYKPGDLDYCLSEIVAVILDDIFGVTGQEKDAEEYISKMKEVKSSKSFDSMELVAKTTKVTHLPLLIRPIQQLLREKLNLNMVKKVDELLRRIGVGIMRNEDVRSREILVFGWEVIQEAHKAANPSSNNEPQVSEQARRYLVNLRMASKSQNRGSTTSYAYKLARFAMEVLRSVLHKHNTLQTPSNLAGFIPIIGDSMLQAQEEVQMAAIRLLTTIIKVPLAEIDRNAPVYISEAVKIIKASPSTNTEIAQAALKLISAILRERRSIKFRDIDIAYLLGRVKPDLDEPDRQGVTFNFLKSVMARKIIIPEVYDVVDTIAAILVTNQTRVSRDLSRGVYFQFIMEYPQAKDRLSKQLAFLVKNLDYKYEEGRQSVLETVHLLVSKVGDSLIQEILGTFFVPLVMMLINDTSASCREMAAVVLKEIFERADNEKTQLFLNLLRTWLKQSDQALLNRVALQCYSLYLEVNGTKGENEVSLLQARIYEILEANNHSQTEDFNWELIYFSLQAFSKVCQLFPQRAFSAKAGPVWGAVRACLSFPHAWIKLSAAKLVGLYFADFARTNAERGLQHVPLAGSGGLQLTDEDMVQLTRSSVGTLKFPGVSQELAMQAVKNLVFLSRCFGANNLELLEGEDEADVDAEDAIEEETDAQPRSPTPQTKLALQFLFERLSAILRRETLTTRAPSLVPKTASIQLIAALCNNLPTEALTPCLRTILTPLHHLTDPSIPAPHSTDPDFNEAYKSITSTAQEIMSLLQKRLGTSQFVAELSVVRDAVKQRREGRRIKRRIEAVMEPEKVGKDKRRKFERKKVKQKERGAEQRGRRRGW
ncbi:putative HEAT repeat protein [Xylona heveae TC161]|uniref:Putative HEAT repeat protein n=1 Tax=Xylona heveae (strain CBS 132557 / TC161) TaxID=1328760 RepID=A0A165GNH0_XYLHT|nr:putative HEAT repeat protein [Xylona heveae TC161]KZF22404.1 putative HEAT repeat protein [Xylona heveae TC161]